MSWNDYGMELAKTVARKSKDVTKHGAVLLGPVKEVIATGFNGPPANMDDGNVDWTRPSKYRFITHAESNCLFYAAGRYGVSLYVTGPPCSRCVLEMVRSGVCRCVYGGLVAACVDGEEWKWSQRIAELGGLELVPYRPTS